jgi:hypothetical protein
LDSFAPLRRRLPAGKAPRMRLEYVESFRAPRH